MKDNTTTINPDPERIQAVAQALATLFDENDALRSIRSIERLAKVFVENPLDFHTEFVATANEPSHAFVEACNRLKPDATIADLLAVLEPAA